MKDNTQTYTNQEPKYAFAGASFAEIANEYYAAMIKQEVRKRIRLSQIAGAVVTAVSIALLVIPSANDIGKMLFGLGLLLAFIPTFMILTGIYRRIKQEKADDTTLPELYFYDDIILHKRANGETFTKSYSDITGITESDSLLYLVATDTNASCIDKSLIRTGDILSFKAFITEKTGKEIYRDKKYVRYNKSVWVKFVIAIAAVYAIGMGANYASDAIQNAPKEFTEGEYTITLAKKFELEKTENGNIVFSDGKGIEVHYRMFTEEGYSVSVEDWYDEFKKAAENEEIDSLSLVKKDIGALQYEYITTAENGMEIYVYDAVISENGSIYLTRFMCPKRNKDKNKPDFEKWSDSINIISVTDEQI